VPRTALPALLVLAALAGCGGDDNGKSTVTQTVTTPTSSQPTSTAQPTTTDTTPHATTTQPRPTPAAKRASCGSVGGGFVSQIQAVGVACVGARNTAEDWFRRIQAGDDPHGAVTALTFTCHSTFAGEAAQVRCVNQIDRSITVSFHASP
jgi:hypothetical protein